MTHETSDPVRAALDLRLAVGRIARRIRQIYGARDDTDRAGLLEISVLTRLDRNGPLSSRELAEIESVTPQAIGTALSALERRGLVTRKRDPVDARRVITSVTAAGRRALAGRQHAIDQRMSQALAANFTAAERRQIAAALPLLERFAEHL